jgi:5-methylcytosine-specific restriction endonuclease McrA
MAKRTPLPCSAENCGDIFPKCGSTSTYSYWKCRCAACTEASRQNYLARRETLLAKAKERYHADPEKSLAKSRRYQAENREEIAEQKRQKRLANLEEQRAQDRQRSAQERLDPVLRERNRKYYLAYYQENRERYAAQRRQYRNDNADAIKEMNRRWIESNRERVRANARNTSMRYRSRRSAVQTVPFTADQLAQRFAYYGNACYLKLDGCTGGADHADHVKPVSKDGPHMLANLRPACAHCNTSKNNKWPFAV